jgi:hypothetical protein
MKKVFFIKCVLLMFGLSVFGQTTKADLEQLRKEVGLPVSTSITRASVSFPAAEPIKIYLAIKHDKRAAEDFIDWVEEWNRTNAGQFGQIQIVDELVDADIAAVQFQFGAARTVREDSVRLKIGKGRREDDNDDDRFVLNDIGNSKARVESSVRALKLPLYSYLIVRGSNSSWNVNYSRVDERISGKEFPDLLLQSAVADGLKNR